jgi:hypothetical protein
MLPESHWNAPYTVIEKTRKDQQLQNFIPLSQLWNASAFEASEAKDAALIWNQLFEFQNETLKKAIEDSNSPATYFNQLESACWQYGKSLAEKDWPKANIEHPHDAYLALATLKIGFLKNSEPFILERKTPSHCSFYWLGSPIENQELCMLYHEAFRGYCYHLSRHLRLEIHAAILPSPGEKIKAWKLNLLWID